MDKLEQTIYTSIEARIPDENDYIGKSFTPKLVVYARSDIESLRLAASVLGQYDLNLIGGVWIKIYRGRSKALMEAADRIEKTIDYNIEAQGAACKYCGSQF